MGTCSEVFPHFFDTVGTKLRNGYFEAGIFVCSVVKVFALKDWVRALKFFESGKQLVFFGVEHNLLATCKSIYNVPSFK